VTAPNTIGDFYAFVPDRAGCWNFTGHKNPRGYGLFSWKGKQMLAHRFSWLHHKGDIPEGHGVLHHCDNPSCVSPDHLFTGTHADNMADMYKKGRSHDRTANRNAAKLTVEETLAIRSDCRRQVDIAADYGISQQTVSDISRGRTGIHL